MITLYEISARYQQAFLALADSDLPEDCINDTLEGLEGGFSEKGRAVAAFSLNMQAEIDAMKNVEKRIADRRKAMEAKRDRLESTPRIHTPPEFRDLLLEIASSANKASNVEVTDGTLRSPG